MRNIYSIVLFTLSLILFAACKDEDITPAFIEINLEELSSHMDVSTFNAEHETYYDETELAALASHAFKEVWVYVNNDQRGLYELPCRIPVLEYDSVKVMIRPAVRLNGSSSMRPSYPFTVDGFVKKYYLIKGETTEIESPPLIFKYDQNITIPLLETFENFSTSFTRLYDNKGANIESTTIDDKKVGVISLQDSLSFMIASQSLKMPSRKEYAFLEFDYLCDEDLYTSFQITNNNGAVSPVAYVTMKATNTWKKAYINLTTVLYDYAGGYSSVNLRIIFSGLKEEGQGTTNFYFDNIKVIHK